MAVWPWPRHFGAKKKRTKGTLEFLGAFCIGAGNETRTRDPDLGKVVLYQLSYSRLVMALF